MRTRVKICGFTRPEQARIAALLGIDAIGLVFFAPSPRNVDIEQALAIVEGLPAFTTVVGLFVDESRERVSEVLRRVPIDLLQFHGDEPPAYCESFGRPYIKAVRMTERTDLLAVAAAHRSAKGLLLDTDDKHVKGGSGSTFDWAWVPEECPLPVILAGGLNPANVGQALERIRPYAVDVSSGVESAKGIKDITKMTAFIQAIEQHDHGQRQN